MQLTANESDVIYLGNEEVEIKKLYGTGKSKVVLVKENDPLNPFVIFQVILTSKNCFFIISTSSNIPEFVFPNIKSLTYF